jgi:exopolysaccharide biosynthesis polyprenyl glycosylphosphotransferase
VVLGRRLVRGVAGWLLTAGVGMQKAVIYGAGETGRQLAERLLTNPQYGLLPIGFLDDKPHDGEPVVRFGAGRKMSLDLLGSGEKLGDALAKSGARTLLLAMPKLNTERFQDIQERCVASGISCYYVPLFSTSHLRRFNLTFVGDMPLVNERAPSFGLINRVGKRAFDVAVSALLLLLLSPMFLLIAALIRLSSQGAALFRQERVGQHGKPFWMHKFRSMHTHAPAYAHKPQSGGDPRIFAFGRILRKTSFDEFPQLWNVLKGEMSLVGPRPEMPQIVKDYNAVHRERFLVRPGMTGLWQVSGDRNLPIHEGVDYDLYYIYNQSILLDLVILARTFLAMFGGR